LTETEKFLQDLPIPRAAFIGFTYKHSDALISDNSLFTQTQKIDPGFISNFCLFLLF